MESSLYSIKAIAKAKGVNMTALRLDIYSMVSGDLPAIALIETGYVPHIVLVTELTQDGKVKYISSGKEVVMDKAAFARIYKGFALVNRQAACSRASIGGRSTAAATASGRPTCSTGDPPGSSPWSSTSR